MRSYTPLSGSTPVSGHIAWIGFLRAEASVDKYVLNASRPKRSHRRSQSLSKIRCLLGKDSGRNLPCERDLVESGLRCDRDVNVVRNRILHFDKVHTALMKHIDGNPRGRGVLNRDQHRHPERQRTLDEGPVTNILDPGIVTSFVSCRNRRISSSGDPMSRRPVMPWAKKPGRARFPSE